MSDEACPWLDEVQWPADGLVPVTVQDAASQEVLMQAWMNRAALRQTVESGVAVYFSRSRGKLWRKGEISGHTQRVKQIRLDCDRDSLLLLVEQTGGISCHTGRRRCFYLRLDEQRRWVVTDPVLRDPRDIYGGESQ